MRSLRLGVFCFCNATIYIYQHSDWYQGFAGDLDMDIWFGCEGTLLLVMYKNDVYQKRSIKSTLSNLFQIRNIVDRTL